MGKAGGGKGCNPGGTGGAELRMVSCLPQNPRWKSPSSLDPLCQGQALLQVFVQSSVQ